MRPIRWHVTLIGIKVTQQGFLDTGYICNFDTYQCYTTGIFGLRVVM
jgi:hypothetical protein